MSEAEFNRLLDVVRSSITADVEGLFVHDADHLLAIPTADNDNEGPWPHIPFPDGWIASF